MGIAGSLLLAASCSGIARPSVDLRSVAGTYILESVSGVHAPIAGSLSLTADGHAERRVRFATTAPTGASESVATGTFRLWPDGSLEFAFNESCGAASCVWVVRATRTDQHFTLEYPDPADGPTISETYARR
jgi:hypothetical protein